MIKESIDNLLNMSDFFQTPGFIKKKKKNNLQRKYFRLIDK